MTSEEKSDSSFKRILKEWGIIAAVIAVLYATGLHTQVIGTMQRGLLWTGLMDAEQPEITQTEGPYLSEADFSLILEDENGQSVSLEDFRGDILFINVWATWCPPCIAEMPTIQSLYEHVQDQPDIHFVMISRDENPQKAHDFMRNKSFEMPYYFPESRLPAPLQSTVIPATYIINREGQVIYRKEGIADYSSERFKKWFRELAES